MVKSFESDSNMEDEKEGKNCRITFFALETFFSLSTSDVRHLRTVFSSQKIR